MNIFQTRKKIKNDGEKITKNRKLFSNLQYYFLDYSPIFNRYFLDYSPIFNRYFLDTFLKLKLGLVVL